MVDRIVSLPSRAKDEIERNGFAWYLEGDNAEYINTDVITVTEAEARAYTKAAEECSDLYDKTFEHIKNNKLWDNIGIPAAIVPLIEFSWDHEQLHMLGRFDFAGGIEDLPIKLIEYNADTATLLPESVYFQSWLTEPLRLDYKGQINYINLNLSQELYKLMRNQPGAEPNLLVISLGYIEDQLNAKVIEGIASQAGFNVMYADLEDVIFSDDGVFLEDEDGDYIPFPYIFKFVPWEFIAFEEPELLQILSELIMSDKIYLINPAYTLAFQSKAFMAEMYQLFPDNKYLLPTYYESNLLEGDAYVKKTIFGRLGENISIYDASNNKIEKTKGDYKHFPTVFQRFAEMYKDEDGDIYQPGLYMVNGKASCLSFRRIDKLIIDDDAEFIPHLLF